MPIFMAKPKHCFGMWRVNNQCRAESFHHHRVKLIPHIIWYFKMLNNPVSTMCVFVDKDTNRVEGYAREVYGVVSVGVSKTHRRKGIASGLVNYLITRSPSDEFIAHIKSDNQTSIDLFKKLGFVDAGRELGKSVLKYSVKPMRHVS